MAVKDVVNDVSADLCDGCTKGLEHVMKIVLSDYTAKIKKLRLCYICKEYLNKAVKKVL